MMARGPRKDLADAGVGCSHLWTAIDQRRPNFRRDPHDSKSCEMTELIVARKLRHSGQLGPEIAASTFGDRSQL